MKEHTYGMQNYIGGSTYRRVPKPVAILSTTVLPLDGVYRVTTLCESSLLRMEGVPHYIGHPATREIIESLWAVKAETNLFPGLQPGETALCFSLKPGVGTRPAEGHCSPHQEVTFADLIIRRIERLEEKEEEE